MIFEEFKGTGNSEIILDRKVADKRVFPAIDIMRSGTRKDETLGGEGHTLAKTYVASPHPLAPWAQWTAIEFLLDKLRSAKNNSDFFESMNT